MIKVESITATTSANGAVNLSQLVGYRLGKPILSVAPVTTNANYYCVFVMSGTTQYVIVRSTSDNAPLASSSVTLSVAYADLASLS